MNKAELKQELNGLVKDFFATSDVVVVGRIKENIYQKVLSCPFTESTTKIVINSMSMWKTDVSNYLVTINENDKYYTHQAYLAMLGIITLVDISEL